MGARFVGDFDIEATKPNQRFGWFRICTAAVFSQTTLICQKIFCGIAGFSKGAACTLGPLVLLESTFKYNISKKYQRCISNIKTTSQVNLWFDEAGVISAYFVLSVN